MPDPLHMPPTRTVAPPNFRSSRATLGTVSVVMIARAAASPDSSLRLAHASPMPDLIASIGR